MVDKNIVVPGMILHARFLFVTIGVKTLDKIKEKGIIKNTLWYERLGSVVARDSPRLLTSKQTHFRGEDESLKNRYIGIMANGGLTLQPSDYSVI